MYVLSYKGKPITYERLYRLEGRATAGLDPRERDLYVAARSQTGVKVIYTYDIGLWADRRVGIDVIHLNS